MTGSGTQLPPPDAVKQAVDVACGYLFAGNLGDLLLDLPGFGSLALLGTLLEAL